MAEALRRSEQLASAAKEAFAPYGSASETDVCAFPAPGTGYTAVRSLCLTAERAAEVEAAREALAGAGVTHFGGVSYRSKDEAALRRQALQQAARMRAPRRRRWDWMQIPSACARCIVPCTAARAAWLPRQRCAPFPRRRGKRAPEARPAELCGAGPVPAAKIALLFRANMVE